MYNSYGARLFTAETAAGIRECAEEKRKQNLIVRSGKYEAEVRRLRSTYCTIEAIY